MIGIGLQVHLPCQAELGAWMAELKHAIRCAARVMWTGIETPRWLGERQMCSAPPGGGRVGLPSPFGLGPPGEPRAPSRGP
jgi:hypothetical protein